MKKNIYKILFTIVCMFMTIGIIIANDSGTGTGSGQTGGNVGNSCTGDLCLPNSYVNPANHLYGIRIAFYTSDGTRIASKDYLANNAIWRTTYTQYGNGGTPCTKIDKCPNGEWKQTSISKTTDLQNIFDASGIGININSILGNGSLDKDVLFSQILSPGGVDLGKRLFTNFGIDYQQYYKSDVNSYDLFLVWEPLGSITYKNNAYIGTAHELLTFVDGVPGKFGSGEWSAYQYVSNNLTAGMGCAVNLENSDTFGNKVATKFGTAFSSRSYFGGRLDASEAGTIASYCAPENHSKVTGSKYKPYVLNNDKGFTSPFAIGILWFDDIGNGTPSLSCADVDNYYSGVNICNEIITKGDFNFKEFNYVNAGKKFPVGAENGITKDWYVSNCCGSGDGIDCTPLYNVPSCTEGSNQTLTYKDSSDWEHCIFTDKNNGKNNIYTINPHKWANKLQTLSYYDKNLSSDFCDVYCIEEVYGNFDSNNPTVLAGNHFVWGWSTVRTTRTCRTYKIEWDMFTDALTSANQDVLQEQAEEYLEELNASGYWEKGDERMKDGDICEDGYEDGPCKENNPDGTCKTHEQVCKGWNQVHDCWEYEWKNGRSSATVYGDVDSDGRLESATAYADSFDRCQDTEPSNPASGGNVSYAIDQVNEKISAMKKCYQFGTPNGNTANVLTTNEKATISYIDSTNTYTYQNQEMNRTNNTSYSYVSTACVDTTLDAFTSESDCSGNSCSGTVSVQNCQQHEATGTSETSLELKAGVYQYVIKNPNGLTLKSVHASDFEANYRNSTSPKYNWTNIGYSNFPVPYSAKDHEYEASLQINYSNLGHTLETGLGQTTNSKTAVDQILGDDTNKYGNYGNWSCGYKVESDLVCEEPPCVGDINVIYREIDLYNPFPDTNSKGRNTGANWCSIENCDHDKDNVVVNKYILQNRNVTGNDIYGLEPMYTFIMTPSDIINIRRYNEENTYSSYDGSLDGKNYNFVCTTGQLRNCRSEYLTELLRDLGAENLPGTCKNDRQVYQGDNANSKFEKCRY